MGQRIEFQERFLNLTEQEIDKRDAIAMPYTKDDYSYRRVLVRLADIFAPKEMPGKNSHCLIEFYDQSTMIVKGKYDDICNKINDLENAKIELGDEDLYEEEPPPE
jgi:hypothetical protein